MKNLYIKFLAAACAAALSLLPAIVSAQQAWYIDGYHGGIWGHYPDWNTRFMGDMLKKNPDWKINIELEPETWVRAQSVDPEAFATFRALFADQSAAGARIEYVNPAYGQSYMYNISGESIIRQFSYGIGMIRQYFPTAVFSTYSTEEPCFTSALPQVLNSFGFKYASLKNPNTCFGGYARAHGGGLVNWIGPDGSSIITSPRYSVEALSAKSTWQTIAWDNGPEYINAAYKAGVKHPVGMTLQDAGWKNGPFIGNGKHGGINSTYTTWRNYFANVAKNDLRQDWKVSQEDMLVSLVWGSQVTQRLAQQVRVSENKVIMAEKMAAMAKLYAGAAWPKAKLDSAWRTLLLSQHHDCWIVPYNGKPGDTWADKVTGWTGRTNAICDSIINASAVNLARSSKGLYIVLYNTTSASRSEVVEAVIPEGMDANDIGVLNAKGQTVTAQLSESGKHVFFMATVPATGIATYELTKAQGYVAKKSGITKRPDGSYVAETDLYKIVIDAAHGGVIKSIVAKKLGGKEFVDQANARRFNELRGNFYNDGGFKSTVNKPAEVEVLESGPLRSQLRITSDIAGNKVVQVITLDQGQPRIDVQLMIDWKGNPGIGMDVAKGTYKWEKPAKPFYDDRNKLLAIFPLNLKQQKVYKNAPFDVTESRLQNTFYDRWDSIKNNVLLNWVDVTDGQGKYGMALFTDHTTSYVHGTDFPLALNVQYSGMGLWGKNYMIDGPTTIHYALVPHASKWDKAGIETLSTSWNQPLYASSAAEATVSSPLVSVPAGYEVSAVTYDGDDMLVRLYNASGSPAAATINFNCSANAAQMLELDGRVKQMLTVSRNATGASSIKLSMPRFGFRTIRLIKPKA